MHTLAEASTWIDYSAREAYRYVADVEQFGEWFPGVLSVTSADTLAPGVIGKRYVELVRVPITGLRHVELTVKEAREGEWFVTEGALPGLLPRMEIGFEARSSGSCRVSWKMQSRNDRWWAHLMLPVAQRALALRATVAMQRLKERLESHHTVIAGASGNGAAPR